MMEIENITNRGQAGGVIRSEKLENHKNSTHSEIEFYIFFIIYFFQ